jgi:hypothetical protein
MSLMSRPSRLLTLCVALLQLALRGPFGVLDAMRATDGRDSAAHVEATSGPQCHAPHSDECIICRHLLTGATRSEAGAVLAPQLGCMDASSSVETDWRSVLQRGFHSRAPPVSLI